MSDLDTSLDVLREDLRRTITRPGLDRIAGRARQRSVRRRMQVGAIVAVFVVSVAVPLLRSLPEPAPAAARPPSEPTVPYQLEFADRQQGFALVRECPSAFDACTFTLMATADAGRSWTRRKMPSGTYRDGSLSVLNPTVLLFHTTTPDADDFLLSYRSTDAGRTWTRYGMAAPVLTSPSPIPPDSAVQVVCLSETGPDCVTGLAAATRDGKTAPVPVQPPLTNLWPGSYPTSGGRYWVVGRDEAGRWAVAVMGGSGRWMTTPLDVPGTVDLSDAWSVVEGGGSMYLTAVGSIGGDMNKLLAVYHSTDRGRTWTQTRRAATTGERMSVYGSPMATSDGRLVLNSLPGGTVESRDGGATFVRVAHQLPGSLKWTPAGYLIQVRVGVYEISWNGVDWRRFEIR